MRETKAEGEVSSARRSPSSSLELRNSRRVRGLFDGRAPLVHPLWYRVSTVLEHANKLSSVRLVGLGEEGDRLSFATGATGSADAVDVLILRKERALV